MPITGGKRNMGQVTKLTWFKRGVTLAFLAVGLLVLLDQLGFNLTSLAQRRPQRAAETQTSVADDCAYLKDPESFRNAQLRHRRQVSRVTEEFAEKVPNQVEHLVNANDIPRKNFIDDLIFDKMQNDNVPSAPLCTDEEFVRRIYLDLTGRIPSPEDMLWFLADENPNKRDALVDRLLDSPEFVDKWTMFYGDLFKNTTIATNVNRFFLGRDAYHRYLKDSVANRKSWRDMAIELITAKGDSYINGEVGFIVGSHVPGGPAQDIYDGRAVEASRIFLGLSSMDCLLCHDGAGHLSPINLWGGAATRFEAYGMAAFFARTNNQFVNAGTNFQKHMVTDVTTGEYNLNTNSGNRSARTPMNGRTNVQPNYMFNGGGGVKAGENRRETFARYLVADSQFARAHVNYIWEKLMVEGLVSPSNTFDLARLLPGSQMPEGWSLQPANPELLQALTEEFAFNGFDIRHLIGLIAKSSTYQLSSQYPGEWQIGYVPYYARKFDRRLDAEEIHDAIVNATGIPPTLADPDNGNKVRVGYRLVDNNSPSRTTYWVEWAMQLPEPAEPRSNGANATFINSFLRGDRDQKLRTDDPSILQALNMMNNGFVMNRIHQGNTATVNYPEVRQYQSAVRVLLATPNLTNDELVTRLYLNTLSRYPTEEELAKVRPYFSTMTRQQAAESLQWVLLNKIDFLFNY
jgi:hypothetical protein